ncbi:MAG: hypothetical protein M1812_004348 [Candelaria pacifica]|nr:MAG: hypothetical protein M1812_004348 [Candelaria pacifica]
MAGLLVGLVGKGIGLTREAQAARKAPSPSKGKNEDTMKEELHQSQSEPADQKDSQSQAHLDGQKNDDTVHEEEVDNDEEQWDLDDAQREYAGPPAYESSQQGMGVDDIVQTFTQQHSLTHETVPTLLPCPVILPQRRPKNKSRGFVRAYAPVLNDCGIDQATFLDFLDSFDKAIKASPVFIVAQVAFQAMGMVPEPATQIASAVGSVVVETARRVTILKQTNKFLEQMNDKLFKPHGLFCLMMSFKPGRGSSAEPMDITQRIAKSGNSGMMNSLRRSDGKTIGELQLPEAAPLIFPALDALPEEQKVNAFKSSGNFMADYFDRRAQAIYIAQNPDSKLNVAPPPKFASRYSDPNHPANSGSIVALATGGKIVMPMRKEGRRSGGPIGLVKLAVGVASGNSSVRGEEEYRGGKGGGLGGGLGGGRGRRQRSSDTERRPKGPIGMARRSLKQDVVYLMVVNMPSEQEMEAAMVAMNGPRQQSSA